MPPTDNNSVKLEYELDAEEYLNDRITLKNLVKKVEDLDQFIRAHMENEKEKFAKIQRYILIIAIGIALQAAGLDLATILSMVASFL